MTRAIPSQEEQDLFAILQDAFGEEVNPYETDLDPDYLIHKIIGYYHNKEKIDD